MASASSIIFFFMAASAAMFFFFLFALQSQSYYDYQPNTIVPVHEMFNSSRKVLKKGSEVEVGLSTMNIGEGEKKKKVERELREAPMGPDPLHHHGASPISKGSASNNKLHPANP